MALLLAGCGAAASPHTHAGPAVHFLADQAAHPQAHNEWWYLVGHLTAGARHFGYEVTIFKFAHIRPPGFTAPVTLYRTDLAITDQARQRLYHRITTYFPQQARLSGRGLNETVGNASLRGPAGAMRLRAGFGNNSLHLQLDSRRPPMDVGGRGYIPFGNGYSYYYSLTDVATHGTLVVAGQRYPVSGISWLDHQWGNWSWQQVRGWQWMALQLSDGTQLSVFDFHGAQRVRAASVLLPNGQLRTIHAARIRHLGTWRSPHTHALYPSGWEVTIGAIRARLRVEPSVLDQEMTIPGEPRASYWEGSGTVRGTLQGKRVTGLSYTELTGYAGRSRLP